MGGMEEKERSKPHTAGLRSGFGNWAFKGSFGLMADAKWLAERSSSG